MLNSVLCDQLVMTSVTSSAVLFFFIIVMAILNFSDSAIEPIRTRMDLLEKDSKDFEKSCQDYRKLF